MAAVGGLAVLIARLARSGEAEGQGDQGPLAQRALRRHARRHERRAARQEGAQGARQERARKRPRPPPRRAAAQEPGKRIYVLGFKGDMRASAVKRLGSEIDAVLIAARPGTDEAVDQDRKPRRNGDRLWARGGRNPAAARAQDQSHRLGRSGGGERRLHDGLRRGPHRRRAVRGRRLDRRRRAGPEPPPAPQEERDRLRGDDGGRVQAHRLGARRDHAGGPRAFPRQARRRRTRRSRPMSRSAGRTSTSPRSPTATIGWRARRWRSASSTNSRPATSFCSAPATARASTR